jgi:hypothetical protein
VRYRKRFVFDAGERAMKTNGHNGNGGGEKPETLEPPQREAAYFYGLFLRGHSLEQLRRDIDVPGEVVSRWQRLWRREPASRQQHEEMLLYRRQVLAIFNALVSLEVALSHLRQ